MSALALSTTQTALYAALTDDDTLMALVARVYDAVPDQPEYDHIVIGEAVEIPERTFGQGGHDILATVTVYTRDGSTKKAGRGSSGFAAGHTIMDRITTVLLDEGIDVDGHDTVDVDVDSTSAFRDPDGATRVIEARFRIRLEDAA